MHVRNGAGDIAIRRASGQTAVVNGSKSWRRSRRNDIRFVVTQSGNDYYVCAMWRASGKCGGSGYRGRQTSTFHDVQPLRIAATTPPPTSSRRSRQTSLSTRGPRSAPYKSRTDLGCDGADVERHRASVERLRPAVAHHDKRQRRADHGRCALALGRDSSHHDERNDPRRASGRHRWETSTCRLVNGAVQSDSRCRRRSNRGVAAICRAKSARRPASSRCGRSAGWSACGLAERRRRTKRLPSLAPTPSAGVLFHLRLLRS